MQMTLIHTIPYIQLIRGLYPDCTLPSVLTHMTAVLKQEGLTCYAPTDFTSATSILCNDMIGLHCAIDQV